MSSDTYVYRILHIDNLRWQLAHGLQCRSSAIVDPEFIDIGAKTVIDRRHEKQLPVTGSPHLSDFVPWYFGVNSVMLLNLLTGWKGVSKFAPGEIIHLVSSLEKLEAAGKRLVIADRNAAIAVAEFFEANVSWRDRLDWQAIRSDDFKKRPDDPGRFERRQAECLVHGCVEVSLLEGICCANDASKLKIQAICKAAGANLRVAVRPQYYWGLT